MGVHSEGLDVRTYRRLQRPIRSSAKGQCSPWFGAGRFSTAHVVSRSIQATKVLQESLVSEFSTYYSAPCREYINPLFRRP